MSNIDTEMPLKAPSRMRGPLVQQFVIYLENKLGVLLELTRTLGRDSIHICGISIVDTADAAVIRMVVDDPEACRRVLEQHDIPFTCNPVLVVRVKRGPEQLEQVLRALVEAEANLNYMYALINHPQGHSLIAVHCEDPGYARFALERSGLEVLTQADLSR